MDTLLGEIDWNTLLMEKDALVMIMGPTAAVLIILGSVIAIQWRKVRQAEHDARLKERMIERGFSAEEIERVMGVRLKPGRGRTAKVVVGCCDAPDGGDLRRAACG